MNPHELKALRSRHQQARAKVDAARAEFDRAAKVLQEAEKEMAKIGSQVAKAQKDFQVTEHAVLRYAERVNGLDLKLITATLTQQLKPMVDQLGDGRFPIAPGVVAVVRDKAVITIEPS